jgi:2-polyprenyl-3-methyl-5-hydroxy-6-metoxy-1,4-benzoquinol methylase
MKNVKEEVPVGFESPTALPETKEQAAQWQQSNKAFWEKFPMRYDWNQEIQFTEFSKEYYLEIDRRFFESLEKFMPSTSVPFDYLVDFEGLREQDVLEIGVGSGIHAQLLASYCKSFVGIDITAHAVESTSRRMQVFGLKANIKKMDAESMQFEANSFDFVWSWGVIHHSSSTSAILQEIRRVLRPGGRAVIMVYHRNWWNYWVVTGLIRGVLLRELRKRTLNEILQESSDGGLARFYTIREWRELVLPYFDVEDLLIFGQKSEMFPLPAGRVKDVIMFLTPNCMTRTLTNRLRLGGLLVSRLRRP